MKRITKYKIEVSGNAYLFFVMLLSAFSPNLVAQNTGNKNTGVQEAYYTILALRLEEGRNTIRQSPTLLSDAPLKLYAENIADILELLLTDDPSLYEASAANEQDRLNIIDNLADSNPYKKFLIAEIKLQWAFVKLKFGDELAATWSLNKAYRTIVENTELFPQFLPNKKTFGIFNIIFGAVPQKYQWVLKALSMRGSTEIGVSHLTDLSKSAHVFSLESTLLLALTETYLLGNEMQGIERLQKTALKNPHNKLVRYLLVISLLKNNQAEKALSIHEETNKLKRGYLPIDFTHYLKGEIMLQKGDYEAASSQYNLFLSMNKGENFVKDSYYKLFIVHYLADDGQKARYYLEKAKKYGSTITEADKYANNQIAQQTYPDKELLKIRYATDGGYYLRADSLIKLYRFEDFPTLKVHVEFTYRKARLSDKQGLRENAKNYYLSTIEMSGVKEWYFAPNAALQLGYIFTNEGKFEKAKFYFEKAIAYKNHDYKTSIDNKAEAGLEKLD